MDAFLTTLLAASWAEMGDRTQILCAVLALRFGKERPVIYGLVAATLLNSCLSAYGGAFVGTLISEDAEMLFYALSFAFAGAGMLWWRRSVDTLEEWKTGPFWTSFLGIFILQLGDKGQFIIAGTAARTQAPEFAALGGAIGIIITCMAAIILRERLAQIVPVKPIRIAGGVIFLLVGLIMGMLAFGLFG